MAKGRKTGGGSRAGIPNKVSGLLKDMILGALEQAGGQAYLARQAEENPTAFMALLAKVMPLQVAGDGGGALVIRWERETPDAMGR